MYNALTTELDRVEVFQGLALSIPAMSKTDAYRAAQVVDYLYDYPALVTGTRAGRPNILLEHGVKQVMGKWLRGRRKITSVSVPRTIPDPAVGIVLNATSTFPVKTSAAIGAHLLCMAAENVIGNLLEHYIAETLEPMGWVWASGETIRAVDFIKRTDDGWVSLQVKNRSNSENSSSAAIRAGTDIIKWHRIHAYTGDTYWHDFPEKNSNLSEDGFMEYIKRSLG